jgi:glycosyltransferase involved in cell wall biosynthesis
MRIAIDASQIIYGTGVSLYTANLLKALSKIDKQNDYLVFGSSLRRKKQLSKKISELKLGKNFQTKIFSLPPSYFEIFWNRFHVGSIERFLGSIDVIHASDWTSPPVKAAKLVTTIHDLAVLKYSKQFHPRIIKNHKLRLAWVKKEADAVIAVSNSTKSDIITFLEIPEKKIQVIYEDLPQENKVKISKADIKRVLEKYHLKDFLLFVGLNPRKNLIRVAKAFETLNSIYLKLKLVVVGKKQHNQQILKKAGVKKSKHIIFIESLNHKDLAALYSQAKCLLYPSLYEGFGLPILEAFYYSCPVITSNISSMPEVAGNAALIINPQDLNEIIMATDTLLKDKKLADKLILKGKKQLRKFSWEKAAKKTLQVYQSLK